MIHLRTVPTAIFAAGCALALMPAALGDQANAEGLEDR